MRALLLALALVASPALAKVPAGFDDKAFVASIERVRGEDLTVDMLKLRQDTLLHFDYAIPSWAQAGETFDLIATDPAAALAQAEAQLKINYLDFYAHVAAETALTKLGRSQEAARHHALVMALIGSVTRGNDGESAKSAWNVVSIGEEYAILNLMGLDFTGQSLANEGGHTYDVMAVKDPETGREFSIWFEIDSFFGKEFEGVFD